uniref:ZP domain-containing protein n=1 Tax=Oryzias melastigma TaxID=30732 RepID=A0A3B3BK71_ORYME
CLFVCLFVCLFLLLSVSAGAQQTFGSASQLDISTCPITFYGKTYRRVYVNFTSENFVVCFGGFFSPNGADDCLLATPPDSQHAKLELFRRIPILETLIHNSLPSIRTSMDCFAGFSLQHSGQPTSLALVSFGRRSALYLYTTVVDVLVSGTRVETVKVTNTPGNKQIRGYLDTSGCFYSGVVYEPGRQVNSPETCLFLNCSEDVGLQVSACGPLERCQGNGRCVTCSVVGPAVLDVHGQLNFVEDRCSYALLSAPDLQIVAMFQERRRKDVSFLDGLILQMGRSDVHINLDPGGRVRLNNLTMVLNSSAQTVYGVEMSKDQTGVTVQVSHSNLTATAFFNGDSVQLHLAGPAVPSVGGLCGNASVSLGELRLPEFSSTSCETRYSDTVDTSINCTRMSERCDLLKGALFSSCTTDPEPYITACMDVLCKYPDLDGLRCQFLEVYARACSQSNGAALQGWRSKAECSPPVAICQDRTCGPNEFCSETRPGGQTRCLCRALFASKYLGRTTLGGPAVCRQNSASLTLVGCLLEDRGINYTQLHLNDAACRGQMDEQTHMLTFSFNSSSTCGAQVLTNSSHVIYKNTIRGQNGSSDTHHGPFHVDFSCAQTRPGVQTVAFSVRGRWRRSSSFGQNSFCSPESVLLPLQHCGPARHIWILELHSDPEGNRGRHGDGLLGGSVHAPVEAPPTGVSLFPFRCASPADHTVQVERNGQSASSIFSFKMFGFSESSGDVFLHCRLQLCFRQKSCSPVSPTHKRLPSAHH